MNFEEVQLKIAEDIQEQYNSVLSKYNFGAKLVTYYPRHALIRNIPYEPFTVKDWGKLKPRKRKKRIKKALLEMNKIMEHIK